MLPPSNTVADRVAELAAKRLPGFTLPQGFYTDAALFEHDLERIFFRHWLLAGHVARLPKPGSYFLYEMGDESLIITRDGNGVVHALWNVCRHRGSRVCGVAEGKANSFACPYHAWTYAPDGRLIGAPSMGDDFDREAYGLKRARVQEAHGLIFLFLGEGEPPDLGPVLKDIDPFLKPYHLAGAKLAVRKTWDIKANWKLVVENFAECYHCGPAHPEYCAVMDHALVDGAPTTARAERFAQQKKEWEAKAQALGHFTGRVVESADGLHTASRIPIGGGRLSQSRTGAPLSLPMGNFKECDGGAMGLRVHPGGYVLGSCDHVIVNRFTPLAVDRTLQEMLWLVHPDAVEGRDYDVEELSWLWRVTTDQDLGIIEDNQRGVSSRVYEPGPYSQAEPGPDRFVRWYLGRVASE